MNNVFAITKKFEKMKTHIHMSMCIFIYTAVGVGEQL